MNRRDFFNISLPAAGAVMIAPAFLNYTSAKEISNQFSRIPDFDEYDLVINGAGLLGYFAAIQAAKKGLKVLLVEKRSSPGFDIAAKRKLWIGSDGFDRFDNELTELFFPKQEIHEINRNGGTGPNKSQFGDELLLFAGSVRKGMLRNLLIHKVHVLLMTDVCGLFTDHTAICGVLLSCKQGLFSVKCKNFLDASDNLLFSRNIAGQEFQIDKAGFVLELLNAKNPQNGLVKVSDDFGLINNQIWFHQGKNIDHQVFLEFEFPASGLNFDQMEIKARLIAGEIGQRLSNISNSLEGAVIHQMALECSAFPGNDTLHETAFNGHYLLPSDRAALSCAKILQFKSDAEKLANKVNTGKINNKIEALIISGAKIPIGKISFEEIDEPGISVPLKKCSFNAVEYINDVRVCQVLVAGGGTAGAMAGIGAAEKWADTMVVDYFNDLGGTKTVGGVMGYYHGVKNHKYLIRQEEEATQLASELNMTKKTGRTFYLLKQLMNSGGKYVSGAIICNSIVKNKKVEGVLICRNGKLEILKGDIVIDSTGDGDVAGFAGANYFVGDTRFGVTQNYSQWDIAGAGKLPSSTSRDYDIIDTTKISELQRGLFLSHYESHFYDFHPYLTVRESRRVEGLYKLDLIDAVEGTHFKDLLSIASSDFDPHYVGKSEFTRCGFLLPHSNVLTVEIPYRSIVPKGFDGLLISGRAISQSQNALQFTRMSADILVLGYLTGQIAAHLAIENIQPKDYNISSLQKEWADIGYLNADLLKKDQGNSIFEDTEINTRIKNLASGKKKYLYDCCRLPKEKAISVLKTEFERSENSDGKLLLAKAMAWFGEFLGNNLIENELIELFNEELKLGYPDGYVENYDHIRGREENVLEGLFWRINQNIALLAMAGNKESTKTIRYILENTQSGGGMVSRENEYFNGRIDLRIIPFYNRIMNLCFFAERLPDKTLIHGFEKLLEDENISGYMTEKYESVRWRVYGGDLELYIGSVLARCGSKTGYDILINYLDDIHYNFKKIAATELHQLTGQGFNYDSKRWKAICRNLVYPQPTKKLETSLEM